MVSFPKFRLRSPGRDRETDEARLNRLEALLLQLVSEVSAERTGLGSRHRAAIVDASFLMEAVENGEDLKRHVKRVDDLTSSIREYELRMGSLAQQKFTP